MTERHAHSRYFRAAHSLHYLLGMNPTIRSERKLFLEPGRFGNLRRTTQAYLDCENLLLQVVRYRQSFDFYGSGISHLIREACHVDPYILLTRLAIKGLLKMRYVDRGLLVDIEIYVDSYPGSVDLATANQLDKILKLAKFVSEEECFRRAEDLYQDVSRTLDKEKKNLPDSEMTFLHQWPDTFSELLI